MEIWKANDEIHDKMKDIVAQNHPDLALVVDEILILFRERARNSGGQVMYGTAKKIGNFTNAVAGTDYKFVLEIGADTWENDLNSRKQEALLDHLLMHCRCEEDPKSGDVVCTIASPDIRAFRENIDRYGMWFPKEEEDLDVDLS